MDQNYWDLRVENARNEEEFKAAMDGMLSWMVDAGIISMSWDDDHEEFVFFMTPDQRKLHDFSHPG